MDLKSPSSGDCVVAADADRHDVWAPTSQLRWQPRFTESGTPTGTGAESSNRVRMEAGRIGGGESRTRSTPQGGASMVDYQRKDGDWGERLPRGAVVTSDMAAEGRFVWGAARRGGRSGRCPEPRQGASPLRPPAPFPWNLDCTERRRFVKGSQAGGDAALDKSPPLRTVSYEEGKGASIRGAVLSLPLVGGKLCFSLGGLRRA